MSIFAGLVLFSVLGVSICDTCGEDMRDGATTMHNKHCPYFESGRVDSKDYFECLTKKGLPIQKSLEYCAEELKLDATEKAFCNSQNPKQSIDFICCVVSQELSGTNMTGCDKVDYSRWCIDELLVRNGVAK